MSGELKESDWKALRDSIRSRRTVLPATLDEIEQVASAADRSCHERYLDVLRLVERRSREMADAFNDMRRSRALERLTSIQSHELLTEEELGRFSPEMREALRLMLEMNESRSTGRPAGRLHRLSLTEERDAP